VVPMLMAPTVLVAVVVLIRDPLAWQWAGVAALVVFVLSSFLGTVPINIRVIEWRADDPPSDWRATVTRWERIDVLRSTAAIVAFVAIVIAAV
jgi:uncharacterized membrane protein